MDEHDLRYVDLSEDSLRECFDQETHGISPSSDKNGFLLGKVKMSITVAMWKEDLSEGNLFLGELYADPRYPHWWLNQVFKRDRSPQGFPE